MAHDGTLGDTEQPFDHATGAAIQRSSPIASGPAEPLSGALQMIRATVTGGVLFLLPIIVLIFFLGKGLEIARRLSNPVVSAIGIETVGGVALGTIVAILMLALVAFLAGLLARTKPGHATLTFFENSVMSMLPQFRMARGLAQSMDAQHQQDVQVVLVPTDAGWTLGFVLEPPDGEWWSVFVPGAPQWTSGSLVFAHADDVKPAGISFAQAIMLTRRCGTGTADIRTRLSTMRQKGDL